MEIFSISAAIAFIKPIIPNIIGGALSIKDEITNSAKEHSFKKYFILVTMFILAVSFGYYLGGFIIEYLKIEKWNGDLPTFSYAIIMILATASSLRFIKKFTSRIEEILDLIFDGFIGLIKTIFKMDK